MGSHPTATLLLSTPTVTSATMSSTATMSPTALDNVPTVHSTTSPNHRDGLDTGMTDVLERGVAIGFSVLALVVILLLLSWLVSKVVQGRKKAKKQNENGVDIEMGNGTGATGVERVDGFADVHLASPQPEHVDDDVDKENGGQSGRAKSFSKG